MKKFMSILLALALIPGLALALAACGGDGDGENGGGGNSIVGNWISSSGSGDIEFKSDGAFVKIFHGSVSDAGTYAIDGDKITMQYTEGVLAGSEREFDIELDKNSLTITDNSYAEPLSEGYFKE
ncbi:MAG: lipocalin family protein [Oscillospiraceae bacterium]|nr:lipocalin family protein [Oscillospiraceae bacterium]